MADGKKGGIAQASASEARRASPLTRGSVLEVSESTGDVLVRVNPRVRSDFAEITLNNGRLVVVGRDEPYVGVTAAEFAQMREHKEMVRDNDGKEHQLQLVVKVDAEPVDEPE